MLSDDRDDQGRWTPGHSGNPLGRPRAESVVAELAAAETEASLALLVRLRDDEAQPGRLRMTAALALLRLAVLRQVEVVPVLQVGRLSDAALAALTGPDPVEDPGDGDGIC